MEFTGRSLPIIGLSGNLVIIHMMMRITVPPMPTYVHSVPQALNVGRVQNTCEMPATTKKIPTCRLLTITFEANDRCNIPAIRVHPAAA